MVSGDFFGKLNLNVWYKLLVYFGGIIFILSLFFPIQNLSQTFIQQFGLAHFSIGLFFWILTEIIDWISTLQSYYKVEKEMADFTGKLILLVYSGLFIIFAIYLFTYWWSPIFKIV